MLKSAKNRSWYWSLLCSLKRLTKFLFCKSSCSSDGLATKVLSSSGILLEMAAPDHQLMVFSSHIKFYIWKYESMQWPSGQQQLDTRNSGTEPRKEEFVCSLYQVELEVLACLHPSGKDIWGERVFSFSLVEQIYPNSKAQIHIKSFYFAQRIVMNP